MSCDIPYTWIYEGTWPRIIRNITPMSISKIKFLSNSKRFVFLGLVIVGIALLGLFGIVGSSAASNRSLPSPLLEKFFKHKPSTEIHVAHAFQSFCRSNVFQTFLQRCQIVPPPALPPVPAPVEPGDCNNDDSGDDEETGPAPAPTPEPTPIPDPMPVPDPTPTPPPPPLVDHLVINELVPAPSTGNPEWIELYNQTGATINLNGWKLADNFGQRVITLNDYQLPSGQFVVIANVAGTTVPFATSTINFISLSGAIGNGLANSGDELHLLSPAGLDVDTTSFGSNAIAFTPSVPAPGSGKSISRVPNGVDSNTALDWQVLATPTPGA